MQLFDTSRNLVDFALERFYTLQTRQRLLYCDGCSLKSMLSGKQPPAQEFQFSDKKLGDIKDMSADFALKIDFIQSLEPFRMLSVDDKVVIAKAFLRVFHILEMMYTTFVNRGHRTQRIYFNNNTFMRLKWDDLGYGDVVDGKDDKDDIKACTARYEAMNLAEISPESIVHDRSFGSMVIEQHVNSMTTVVEQMEKIGMTDIEFVALALLVLFDPQREDISELTRKVLHSVRSQIFSDWLEVYAVCGIEKGEERMGNSVLLMASVMQAAHTHKEHWHLFRLFGHIEYDKMLDELYCA